MSIRADDITTLLAEKHGRDLFVSQCKTGNTWFNGRLGIMDAWAMKRSWAHPLCIGYEIKVSRSDFLSDGKWPGYLAYCNEFFFVAPKSIIQIDELPAEVGLLTVSANGRRLFTAKKATYRDIEINPDIFRYILISRATITGAYEIDRANNLDYWRAWLRQKAESREIGRHVARALRERFANEVTAARERQAALDKRLEGLRRVEEFVERCGINLKRWNLAAEVEQQIARVRELFPQELVWQLKNAQRSLATLLTAVAEYKGNVTDLSDKTRTMASPATEDTEETEK